MRRMTVGMRVSMREDDEFWDRVSDVDVDAVIARVDGDA